jgi:nucleotide-binding universal stress UspA family protein
MPDLASLALTKTGTNSERKMAEPISPPAVVVGIDGSRSALRAALWAVDEAVDRDIPLRLVYAVDQFDKKHRDPDDAARKLATAETAVRCAVTAIESTDKPVKIEVEISQERAIDTLVRASRSAAVVCVGDAGINHFQPGRVGSTAAAVATQAHCAVAIIRQHDGPKRPDNGWITVVTDESPDDGVVLEAAMEEARIRNAPLRVITCWHSRFPDTRDGQEMSEGNRQIRADLARRLARWNRRYPDLRIEPVAVHGNIVDYLKKHSSSMQLVILPARDSRDVKALIGPAGNTALEHSDCSLLIVNRRHL